jgi:two-component system chemotaxis sensor kinase CheA
MTTKNEEFLKKLQATFRVEASEHLQVITDGLLKLEKNPLPEAQYRIIETVFRAAHSLKGAARAVDFTDIESSCQLLEDVFAIWKRQEATPSLETLDALHRDLNIITSALATPASPADTTVEVQMTEPAITDQPVEADSVETLSTSSKIAVVKPATAVHEVQQNADPEETVRVAVAKLEASLLQAEEMLMVKLTTRLRSVELRELSEHFEAWQKAWVTLEPEVRELRRHLPVQDKRRSAAGLTRLLDFFDWSMDYLKLVESKTASLGRTMERDGYHFGKLVDDLMEGSKKLLLLPFGVISASLPKLVRDQCRDQGKKVDLNIQGDNIEIDKRILEGLKDPLIHLLRNCIDHGIEMPDMRVQQGKPERATIKLEVSQISGNKVRLMLSDDGAGINTAKVKASAIKHGLISVEDAALLNEVESLALIFQSAVSTSPIITQLSGRGLGLTIVREKVDKLGGEVSVSSQLGTGTVFNIIMPTTLANLRGIVIEVAGQIMVVPTTQVDGVTRASPADIQTVEGCETISYDGSVLALIYLAQVLELTRIERKDSLLSGIPVIVLGSGDRRVAFVVDAVLDEQEILVKPLRKPLSRVRNVSAVTILGSGQVAPILNIVDLLNSARQMVKQFSQNAIEPTAAKTKAVLVAEDSITSRLLLKGILESAGYRVKTAVDGMEAFTMVRAEHFDLVVSDVEMPRLNGFDLTTRIRADQKLASLPVILVTALETRDDRERGLEAGANAYLIKSSFDQGNLLETIQRLI